MDTLYIILDISSINHIDIGNTIIYQYRNNTNSQDDHTTRYNTSTSTSTST